MVGVVTKVVVGLALFVGSLFGGLALTGRLNHEGTANIPLLSSFFPVAQSPAGSATAAESARAGEDDDAQGPSTSASLRPTMGGSLREPEPASAASHGDDPHAQGQHGGATHDHDDASAEAARLPAHEIDDLVLKILLWKFAALHIAGVRGSRNEHQRESTKSEYSF